MTPPTDRPPLDGCTVAGTSVRSGGEKVGDLLGEVYRPIPLAAGAIGDIPGLGHVPIPVVNWSIQFLYVHPKEPESPLFRLPVFVLPSVGLEGSVAAMQNWFFRQTGSRLRIRPDIKVVSLNETDDQIAAHGEFVRDRIETLLRDMGFDHPFTMYAAWYAGTSNHACGGGAWPHGVAPPPNQQTPGHLAALYLWGAFGDVHCAADQFTSDGETPAIQEFKMLHEIVHTMGIVSPGAPHHTRRGHVSDDPNDLMYAGPLDWRPSVIDAGHDDYFQTGRTDINDLSRSVWLNPSPPDAQPPPGW